MAYNSDYFDLTDWKLTLPADKNGGIDGKATEVKDLVGYENPDYFYDAPDGAMVFVASADGATTGGSKYPRCELREMDNGERAAWSLNEGGTMTATLQVDSVPDRYNGKPGRIIVGQIHGEDDELVRLYYQGNTVYFVNEHAGPDDDELTFQLRNSKGETPDIDLGEKFSYLIDARDDTLTIEVYADGDVYSSKTEINDIWSDDSFYFKAGLYLGVNEDIGEGKSQVSFYGLDFSHTPGEGLDGLSPDSGDDTLVGTHEADVLKGYAGDDTLTGLDGDDTLLGGVGNDVLEGAVNGDAQGIDILDGGDGDDTIFADRLDTVRGGQGTDTLTIRTAAGASGAGIAGMTIQIDNAHADVENVYGSRNDDVIDGSAVGQERLTLRGSDGDDVITGGAYRDMLYGGNDDDILAGGDEGDYLKGENGNDWLDGGTGNDLLRGGAGQDEIDGGTGNDVLHGGDDADTLLGGQGNDRLYGSDSVDGQGSDLLDGGDGDDRLYADASDTVFGGAGHDQIIARGTTGLNIDLAVAKVEETWGGDYADIFDGSGVTGESLLLRGGGGDDHLIGGALNDRLYGGDDDDILEGGGSNDYLKGENGADTLFGGAGNDRLRGGSDDDVLDGGLGQDDLTGDAGADLFANTGGDGIVDNVTDYNAADGDAILNGASFTYNGHNTYVYDANGALLFRLNGYDADTDGINYA